MLTTLYPIPIILGSRFVPHTSEGTQHPTGLTSLQSGRANPKGKTYSGKPDEPVERRVDDTGYGQLGHWMQVGGR